MMAAVGGHVEVIRFLLGAGADVNLANNSGATPLMMAAVGGHVEVLCLLLEAGADVKPGRQTRQDSFDECNF